MATQGEISKIADVLADPANAGRTAEELAEVVLAEVERLRRRRWRYVVIGQDRRRPVENGRQFHPTWVRIGFYTAAEAASAARAERIRVGDKSGRLVHVMGAQCFEPEDEIDPDKLEEVLAG